MPRAHLVLSHHHPASSPWTPPPIGARMIYLQCKSNHYFCYSLSLPEQIPNFLAWTTKPSVTGSLLCDIAFCQSPTTNLWSTNARVLTIHEALPLLPRHCLHLHAFVLFFLLELPSVLFSVKSFLQDLTHTFFFWQTFLCNFRVGTEGVCAFCSHQSLCIALCLS